VNSLNVAQNLNLKSSSAKTISGFSGISAGSVYTSFLNTDEITFYENFGLTVSGELMMSTNSPIKFGSWSFPSTTPPTFSALNIARTQMPTLPAATEFGALMSTGWQGYIPTGYTGGQ
jgi:hypothetical protein